MCIIDPILAMEEESDQRDSPPPPHLVAAPSRKAGGWKSVRFIIANESFEKLASMSLITNMTVYLLKKYNTSTVYAVNTVNIWNGSSNIASLAGAFVSDAYLGRFRTLLFASLASFLGMSIVTLTAGIEELRPSLCQDQLNCQKAQEWQLAFLFTGLGFLSLGAGGIRPCNVAFGVDQFDTNTEKGRTQMESFFNWWYFTFTVALVFALTAVIYIQTDISWFWGFVVPTCCLVFSITVFLIGRHTYICLRPKGSVFTDMSKVVIAAYRKRKLNVSESSSSQGIFFYDSPDDPANDGILDSGTKTVPHTGKFKFLDKAAMIIDPSELNNQGKPRNEWNLCSLQQVQHLKCLLAIIPVWVTAICCFIVQDQQNFGVLQALQMKRSLGPNFEVPGAWMNLTSMLALSIWICIYEGIYVPLTRKMSSSGTPKRLTVKQRVIIGIVLYTLCMVIAGVLERKRRESALKQGSYISPMSFAWLLPQFVLTGLGEAFTAVAIMEFFTMRMPESMRTVAGAVFFLSLAISSYISSFIINIIQRITRKRGRTPWLGGHNLNNNRLENYYFIIAAFSALNFIYFIFFASHYVVDTDEARTQEGIRTSEAQDEEEFHVKSRDQLEI